MLIRISCLLLLEATVSLAAPVSLGRRVTTGVTLDPAAVAEAQVRDDTATRAFSATSITTSDGQCLFVDPTSGDFRENLTPVQTAVCNGSTSQQWDVITAGVHNNVPGAALIVSTLTNACLNFDPRRAAGNQVLLFSCGGRADGGGAVTNSQLFDFAGGAGPLPLVPQNSNNATCLTITNGLLDQTSCDPTQASGLELFTFGSDSTTSPASSTSSAPSEASSTSTGATSSPTPTSTTPTSTLSSPTVTGTGTTVLDPTAVAEAQVRDDTATRAFSSAQIQDSIGQCLTIDPLSGDFRENLIPVTVQACDGSAGQQFDVITSGVHDNVAGAALIVSSETQGCLNFDPRRAAGDQVILFSCGGRADGGGAVTDSQLFNFASGSSSLPLVPQNSNNATCLVNSNGALAPADCDDSADQLFKIVQ